MTSTVTFNSFEMEMTVETTDAEIREFVEYAQQYEFDREDVSADEVQAAIEATISGLIEARDETFDNRTPAERGEKSAWQQAKDRGEILE